MEEVKSIIRLMIIHGYYYVGAWVVFLNDEYLSNLVLNLESLFSKYGYDLKKMFPGSDTDKYADYKKLFKEIFAEKYDGVPLGFYDEAFDELHIDIEPFRLGKEILKMKRYDRYFIERGSYNFYDFTEVFFDERENIEKRKRELMMQDKRGEEVMVVTNKEEIKEYLEYCKAVACSEVSDGGKFYKIKNQSFEFPNGHIEQREFIDKKQASVVVPITKEGNLVFVVQPIALSEEGSLLEFPAGYRELGENGCDAGIRELAEETGYKPETITYLGSHYQDPGSIKAKVEVFLALGCVHTQEQKLDRGEYVKYIEVPYEFALELMDGGYLSDANSYIAMSKTERHLKILENK